MGASSPIHFAMGGLVWMGGMGVGVGGGYNPPNLPQFMGLLLHVLRFIPPPNSSKMCNFNSQCAVSPNTIFSYIHQDGEVRGKITLNFRYPPKGKVGFIGSNKSMVVKRYSSQTLKKLKS